MDRVEALRLFVRLAERGSFTAAAQDLRIKQSTASKWVAALEDASGARLVERTTRALRLTDAGRRFLAGAREVLEAVDALDAATREAPTPAGRVRLSLPVVFGHRHVVPALVPFLRAHPRLEVDLVLADRYVQLVDEGVDLAVRVGEPRDASARSRRLADGRRVLVASPDYLERRGRPARPADLRAHACLSHVDPSARTVWRFRREGGREQAVPVSGPIVANHSETVLALVREGFGIALLADWLVGDDLRAGRLVPLLRDHVPPPAPVFAVWPPGGRPRVAVRALVDHLAAALPARLAAPASGAPASAPAGPGRGGSPAP